MPIPENTSLSQLLQPHICHDFILQSRMHLLNSFSHAHVYVKRDDELSSGITGSKYRKFSSLLPYLKNLNFDEVLLIGSAQSNNIIGLLQLLNEAKISANAMLLESNESDLKGNLLWLNLLHDAKNITWIKRENWPDVNDIAKQYAINAEKNSRKNVFVVEEGASVAQALPGAMTLASDILQQEIISGKRFDHIFIDSGSGTTAIGLLYGLALANISDKNIYITLIAGTEQEFNLQYKKLVKQNSSIYGWPEKYFEGEIHFSRALIAPSFGSITRQVLDEVKYLARTEGILAEPVYTAKHFYTARQIILQQNLLGNILVINSGGSFGLSGFQEKLAKLF